MARIAVCPGSFDPVTNGHLDVVRRAVDLFDEVVVAVVHNPAKRGSFSVEERVRFISGSLPVGAPVRVDTVGAGLLVDYCTSIGATALIKGLRGGTDYDYELPMALMNRHLTGLETVFLPGEPSLGHVSSSLVREVASHGGDVSALVPPVVWTALTTRRA